MNIVLIQADAPRQVRCLNISLPEGATVRDALRLSGWLDSLDETEWRTALSVWGRRADLDQALRDQDRVEWLRPLRVDPKVARRERFRGQGARSTGLFSRQRPGGKPGY